MRLYITQMVRSLCRTLTKKRCTRQAMEGIEHDRSLKIRQRGGLESTELQDMISKLKKSSEHVKRQLPEKPKSLNDVFEGAILARRKKMGQSSEAPADAIDQEDSWADQPKEDIQAKQKKG